MKQIIYILSTVILFFSCINNDNNNCTYKALEGEYMFFSDTDTSENTINIIAEENGFTTTGISGYRFWYPASPLSGKLSDCEIIINSYENVERPGLSSPGGYERNYYENMNGFGEFYPDKDSIKLFINYQRTENWLVNFSGNIYLKKI